MGLGLTFILLAIAIVAIWVIIEAKRMKHKIFAIVLITLILFTYISFSVVLKNNEVNLKTPDGMITGGKLYFSWLGGVFKNMKSITTYALKQDWKNSNLTLENSSNAQNYEQETEISSEENPESSPEESIQNAVEEISSIWDKL